jgi:dolichyl-phosphate-mannose-protein mannosyltransferase
MSETPLAAGAPAQPAPVPPATEERAAGRPNLRPPPSPARTGDQPMVRAGLRGFLALTRVDVAAVVGLILLAFALRFWSPILPNFLGGAAPGSPALLAVGVAAADNSDPSACQTVPWGTTTIRACGQVFDEVYFPSDAADDLHSPPVSYFDPEPPLVKLLMTPSIAWLGFDTLGWRMTQVVTGSLLVGLMYLIALRLRRDRFFAIVAALLVCLDGLAFVESRIGVIDMPAIFFTALAWYLFLLHWQARTRRQWRLSLYVMAAGLGMAFAAKLTAIAPLAVTAALVIGRGLAPYVAAAFPPLRRIAGPRRFETVLWREAAGRLAVLHYAAAAALVVAVFFAGYSRYLTIPHQDVYRFASCNPQVQGLTTLPYPNNVYRLAVPVTDVAGHPVPDVPVAIQDVVEKLRADLNYQALECHGHPSASRWYTWPISEQPVLMYYQNAPLLDNHSYSGIGIITNMGNPAVWWLGLVALLFCVWRMTAGPGWLRAGVGALMVVSLSMMIITFHSAEPPTDPSSGYEMSGPLGHISPLFDVGFFGMGLFAVAATGFAVVSRRFVPAFIVLGYTAAWLMWVPGNAKRVLFFYHALGILIFTALALAYALTALRRVSVHAWGRWWSLAPLAYAGVGLVIAAFVFFYPVWTALPMPNVDAQMRLWVDAW